MSAAAKLAAFMERARQAAMPPPTRPVDVEEAAHDRDLLAESIAAADADLVASKTAVDPAPPVTPAGKRKRAAADQPPPVAKKPKTPALEPRAVAPPHFEFDKKTLGGRPVDKSGGTFRAVFESAKMLGCTLASIGALSSAFPVTIRPDGLSIRMLNAANTLYLIVRVPREAFLEYENCRATSSTIVLSSAAFQTRKKMFAEGQRTLTLAFQQLIGEANDMIVQLYPASGNMADGRVSRYNIPLSTTEYDTLPEVDDAAWYSCEITVAYATLAKVLGEFTSAIGDLAFTVTERSLDLGARCDEHSRQTEQLTFLDADRRAAAATVEDALIAAPHLCAYEEIRPAAKDLVNFRISLLYLRRGLLALEGCRFVRLGLGRCAEFSGEFSPLRMRGERTSAQTGKTAIAIDVFIPPKIETD